MTPAEFIKKWKPVALTERAAAHTHFLDLCKLFEHEDPVSADPTGEWFTFEKGATKTGGGEGFADVWKKNFFAWEYKKKKRDLNAAMDQLVRYAAALEIIDCSDARRQGHHQFRATDRTGLGCDPREDCAGDRRESNLAIARSSKIRGRTEQGSRLRIGDGPKDRTSRTSTSDAQLHIRELSGFPGSPL